MPRPRPSDPTAENANIEHCLRLCQLGLRRFSPSSLALAPRSTSNRRASLSPLRSLIGCSAFDVRRSAFAFFFCFRYGVAAAPRPDCPCGRDAAASSLAAPSHRPSGRTSGSAAAVRPYQTNMGSEGPTLRASHAAGLCGRLPRGCELFRSSRSHSLIRLWQISQLHDQLVQFD